MSEHDTQPLTAEQVELIEGFAVPDAGETINCRCTYEPQHIHGPFTFLLNQNHNALRGCQSCGQTWVGLMAGEPGNLIWHPVAEPPEEEEHE